MPYIPGLGCPCPPGAQLPRGQSKGHPWFIAVLLHTLIRIQGDPGRSANRKCRGSLFPTPCHPPTWLPPATAGCSCLLSTCAQEGALPCPAYSIHTQPSTDWAAGWTLAHSVLPPCSAVFPTLPPAQQWLIQPQAQSTFCSTNCSVQGSPWSPDQEAELTRGGLDGSWALTGNQICTAVLSAKCQ